MHHHRRTTAVRALAFMLGLIIATGIVLGFSSKSDVHAENTAQILEAARQRQASLDAQIQELEQQNAQLAANQTQANAKLAWLNDRNAEQKALFAEKNDQLKESMKLMAEANRAYIAATDNLSDKKTQYRDRLQKMFTHRNKSYFQIFVEAGSLKNFFTTIQFMALVAESDKAMIDDLKTAADDASLKQRNSVQIKSEMEDVVGQINAQIERIKREQNLTQSQLDDIGSKLNRGAASEDALAEEADRIGGEIASLQRQLNDEQLAKIAAARAAEQAAADEAAAERAAAEQAAAEKAAAEKAAADRIAAEQAAAAKAAADRAAAERSEAARIAAERAAAQQAAADRAAAEKAAAAKAAADRAAADRAAADRAAAEKAAALQASRTNSRGWVWPYPADRNNYSAYGWRIHPIYKVRKFHAGMDIGGDYGSPIVAARDGVVVLVRSTWQGQNTGGTGYGNYVIIAHDNGYTTVYGHMKRTLVSVGQRVNAGDRIGLCGSTGTSTAPHLHFEVRRNGSTMDPAQFY